MSGVSTIGVPCPGWNFATYTFYWRLVENKNSDVFIQFLGQMVEARPSALDVGSHPGKYLSGKVYCRLPVESIAI